MLQSPDKKKSTKYANIDMDKFKFDFNLFVPSDKKLSKADTDKSKDQ